MPPEIRLTAFSDFCYYISYNCILIISLMKSFYMKMLIYYVSHLFKGQKMNVKEIQPYLESLGIELTDSESQMIQSTVPLDGK